MTTTTKLSRLFAVTTACFLLANVVPTLTLKAGYEDLHVYEYKADISVGVEEPKNYISKFSLHGVIKVQRDVSQVSVSQYKYLIALTDVKYDSYYGEDAIRISKYQAVDEKVLGSAFTAVYKPSGQLEYTVFKKNEAQWSRQIKKSIASLLQFNWSVAQNAVETGGKVHVAPVEEYTIHGKCFVNYNTTLIDNPADSKKKVNLVKTTYPTKCNKFVRNFDGYVKSDEDSVKTIKKRLDHKRTKIESVYELDVIQSQPIVKKIFNFESYRYDFDSDDFKNNHNPQFVKVRQTLFFKRTEPGHEFLHKSEKNNAPTSNNLDVIINQKLVIGKVKQLLLEANQYMKQNHVVEIKAGAEQRQLLNRIRHHLKDLDADSYTNLYNDINDMKTPEKETMRKILIQITPFVGTKSSLSFIKNMISTKKLPDSEAISLVSGWSIQHAEKLLPDLETFLKKDSGLPPEVQQTGVLSFSQLVGRVCKNNRKFDEASIEKYIRSIDALMKDATTTDAKRIYLTALANTRCRGAVKYIKSVLPRPKNDSKDKSRLRMAAIFFLTHLIDEDDTEVLEELTKILHDKTERRELRILAYKVLVQRSDFDTEDLMQMGRLMSTDEHLRNYHLTTMQIFNKIGILKDADLKRIKPKDATLSPLMLANDMIELESSLIEKLNLGFITEMFKVDFTKRIFIRAAVVRDYDLSLSFASAPTLFEYEFFHVADGKVVSESAGYFYGNLADLLSIDESGSVFAEFATADADDFEIQSLNVSQLIAALDDDELLKFIVDAFRKSMQKSWLSYSNLETFSIPTGFGVDAVYERTHPSLAKLGGSCDWSLTRADFHISADFWSHGYSEISIGNPFTRLRHSARKTHLYDLTISADVIAKYDFTQGLELTIPLITKDARPKMLKGASDYISSSVMISDRDGDTLCPSCGYRYTEKPGSEKAKRINDDSKVDSIGLAFNDVVYDCDLLESNDKVNDNIASRCGKLSLIESDASVSRIEFKLEFDYQQLLSASSPWYFLPGMDLTVESSLGARRTLDGDITTLAKFSVILTSSQGHFLNEGRYRQTIRLGEHENLNVCIDGKFRFPNVTDTHLSSTATDSKLFMDARIFFGKSKSESCVGLERGIEMRYTGEIPQEHVDELRKYSRNSKCARQMQNSTFKYPSGSYLMTKHCIYELISNTTFRRFRLDAKHEEIPSDSVIKMFTLIESIRAALKELAMKKFNLDVDIKSLSKISEIVTNKTMSFQVDCPVRAINKILPSVYFTIDFVNEFINGATTVINVFPKLVLFNNNEKKDLAASLKDGQWTLIASNGYDIYVKLLKGDKLTVKFVYDDQPLILEPMAKISLSDSSYVPGIYYNGYVDDFAERAILKSSEDVLFSLLKVDGYIVVRSTQVPVTIYYTVDSVTILQ